MAAKIGKNAKLYRGTANATATTEMTNVKDLSMPDERSEGDTSSRGSDYETAIATMRKVSVEWKMNADDTDGDYAAIRAAYVTRTPIALKCISGAGGKGIDADFYIFKMQGGYGLKDAAVVDVVAKPTRAGAAPRYPVFI